MVKAPRRMRMSLRQKVGSQCRICRKKRRTCWSSAWLKTYKCRSRLSRQIVYWWKWRRCAIRRQVRSRWGLMRSIHLTTSLSVKHWPTTLIRWIRKKVTKNQLKITWRRRSAQQVTKSHQTLATLSWSCQHSLLPERQCTRKWRTLSNSLQTRRSYSVAKQQEQKNRTINSDI